MQAPTSYTYRGTVYRIIGWSGDIDIYIGGTYAGIVSGPGPGSMTSSLTYTSSSVKSGAFVTISGGVTLFASDPAGNILAPVSGSGTLNSSFRATVYFK